jgi:hypothetical protein
MSAAGSGSSLKKLLQRGCLACHNFDHFTYYPDSCDASLLLHACTLGVNEWLHLPVDARLRLLGG